MTPEPGMPLMVTIEGRAYEVRLTLRTLKALQREQGINLLRDGATAFTDFETLPAILFYALKDANPQITLDWIEDHVDMGTLAGMTPIFTAAIGGRNAGDVRPNVQPPSGTGSRSGPSGDMTSALVNGRSGN